MSISISATAVSGAGSHVGISPLQVFFDATATTSTRFSTVWEHVSKIYYVWNFGDPTSGTWTYGGEIGKSKNIAEGAWAGHIYEITDGGGDVTFTATLWTYDGVSWATISFAITVYDPTGVNGFGSRIIVDTTGSYAGAPAGAHLTTSNWQTVLDNLAPTTRISLKRGQTISKTGIITHLNTLGPWQIDSWGSGAKPIIQANSADVMMYMGDAGRLAQIADIRLVDLTFDPNGQTNVYAFNYEGGPTSSTADLAYYNQLTMLRMDVPVGARRGIQTMQQTGVFVQDCVMQSVGYVSFSGGMLNSAVLGNSFTETSVTINATQEGNSRWGNENKLVISNNDYIGGEEGRQHIKCHAQTGTPSEFVLFSGNALSSYGGVGDQWWADFAPTDSTHDERVRYVIAERNHFKCDSSNMDRGFVFMCQHAIARNNIFTQTVNCPVLRCISVQHFGAEPDPDDIVGENNIAYSNEVNTNNGAEQGLVMYWVKTDQLGAGLATNLVSRNEVVCAPNYTRKSTIFDEPGIVTESNGTVAATPGANWVSSNGIGSGNFLVPADFKLLSGAAIKDTGSSLVNHYADFFGVFRPQNSLWDRGFAEFDVGTDFPWETTGVSYRLRPTAMM